MKFARGIAMGRLTQHPLNFFLSEIFLTRDTKFEAENLKIFHFI